MRPRLAVATGALTGVLCLAAPARAQYFDYKASFSMAAQYARNVTDAPFPTAQTFAGPSVLLSPSLVALYDTPRTNNTLTYAFSLTIPFTTSLTVQPVPLTYSNHLTYSGHYAVNELTTMTLSGGVTETPLNTLSSVTDPTEAPIMVTPSGSIVMVSASLQEGITRELKDSWSLSQSTALALGYPIDPTTVHAHTFTVQNSLGITKNLNLDTIGITATNAVNYFTASEGIGGVVIDPHTQITNTLMANWTRTFLATLTGTFSAGATQIISPAALSKLAMQPSGSIALNYTRELATVSLNYQHMATPNLATGQINFVDSIAGRFSLPFGPEKLGLSSQGSAGFTRATPLGGDGTPGAPYDVIVADATASYKPPLVPTLATSLRFQIQRQIPSADPAAAFTSLAISLTLTYSYPSVQAATVRPRMTPVFSVAPVAPGDFNSSDRPFAPEFNVPAVDDTPRPQPQP